MSAEKKLTTRSFTFPSYQKTTDSSPPKRGLHSLRGLSTHYKRFHPEKTYLLIQSIKTEAGTIERGCDFFGRWIPVSGSGNLISLANAAKRVLDLTFESIEHVFVTDWAPMASVVARSDSYARPVAWDEEEDRTSGISRSGLKISIKGSNLIEAAIWLPRFLTEAQKFSGIIPGEIDEIWIGFRSTHERCIETVTDREIICFVGDFRTMDAHILDLEVQRTIKRALYNAHLMT
ncbi:MAG: hypothetical protein WCT39_01995 [Candidatus Margulisiibacteriota bacterium]